jgi:pimeloyl-ACP methyl ester carboxylesterase
MRKPAACLALAVSIASLVCAAPASGTSSGSSAHLATTSAVSTSIHWRRCQGFRTADLSSESDVQCGSLRVPLNYHRPHGPTVTLAMTLLRHSSSAAHYQGVMLSNPGGPGGSGLGLGPALAADLPPAVSDSYDWVSWDPRGVGDSRPRLSCKPGYFNGPRRSYQPTTKALRHYWLGRSKAYAQACERHQPALLAHLTTRDSVRDMESIRGALGVASISYYGFSYGTYLGEVYSTLHPDHLRRMVLDSSVDPRKVWYAANLNQDKAFDRVINIFFRWVARYHDSFHLGATHAAVSHRYYRTLTALADHPRHRLGAAEWTDAFESAGYDQSTWVSTARAWQAYANGHPGRITQEYAAEDEPGDDNEYAVYNAVQCTDTQWPSRWQRWRRDNTAYHRKYPFLTWSNAWFNAPCLYWRAKPKTPVKVDGTATKSALLIDETLDAATPYSGSLEVRKLYPHSSLIAEPGGTTHADSLSGNHCVDSKIATYLKTGHRPARRGGRHADATCRPLPTPHPHGNDKLARRSMAAISWR